MNSEELLSKISECLKKFSEKFYPELKVELLGLSKEGKIAILFKHFCPSCGTSDYFIDFLDFLNDTLGEKYIIEDMKELTDEGDYWIVVFAPERLASIVQRKKRVIVFLDDMKRKKIFSF